MEIKEDHQRGPIIPQDCKRLAEVYPKDLDGAIPLSYLITFTCYGARLHGSPTGSVDRRHNIPGTPALPPDKRRLKAAWELMTFPPYSLDEQRRLIVRQAIQEFCQYRGWQLLAAHVRTNHGHVVVQAFLPPEKVLNDFKAQASRHLNRAGIDEPDCRRWTRHGSTRYLWKPEQVEAAIHYTVREPGEPLAVYENVEERVLVECWWRRRIPLANTRGSDRLTLVAGKN